MVRNICELTIPLSNSHPFTFTATSLGVGAPSATLGWKGEAASLLGLEIGGCPTYPCDVTARWRSSSSSGAAQGCEITADDGTSRLVGTSTGTALSVASAPTAPVIFNQDVKLGASGTAIAGSCVLRQSAALAQAEVSDLSIFVNDVNEVTLAGPIVIGNASWPTNGPDVPFGTLFIGSEAGATRLKHVAARKEQLIEGDAVRCAGKFYSATGVPVFDVNVSAAPSGAGLSVVTAPTAWMCDPAAFGSGDGCDCDCGIADPDCPASACTVGDVIISEIAWAGSQASTSDEWLELQNTTASTIDVSGWSLAESNSGTTLTTTVTFPAATFIPPDGFLVVVGRNGVAIDLSTCSVPATCTRIQIFGFSSGLGNLGEQIVLRDASMNAIDAANLPLTTWFAGVNSSSLTQDFTMERSYPCGTWDGTLATSWQTNDGITRNGLDSGGVALNGTPGSTNSACSPQ